jgi:hypothetical protein
MLRAAAEEHRMAADEGGRSTAPEGELPVSELMDAWGELDQAIQRCYVPGRLEAERYPEEHLHDLRVKRDRLSRAITSLCLAQENAAATTEATSPTAQI